MPEPIDATQTLDPAANNAAVAEQMKTQGLENLGAKPQEILDSGAALDAIAEALVPKKEDSEAAPAPDSDKAEPEVPVQQTPDQIAAAEAAAKAAADAAEAKRKSDEYFKDSPGLPPNASPKSSEAFNAIKIKAAQEISTRDAQLEETRKKLADAEEKLKAGPSPELLAELEEHRNWRAKLDVDADPKFKEFDKTAAATREFIYAQLKKSPAITDNIIDQIKKHGGPENVNMDKIFAAVKDPTLQRIVESKIGEIEMAKFNKEQAIKSTKENVAQYVAEQQKRFEQNVGAHNTATQAKLSEYTSKLPWFVEQKIDPKADESTRKSAEEHNKFITATRKQLDEALKDDSAEMRAIMLTATAQLLYLQRLRAGEKAQFDAVTKELTEAKAKLEKLTKASVSRLSEGGAPPGRGTPAKPKGLDLNSNAAEALDNIARDISAERARAASA